MARIGANPKVRLAELSIVAPSLADGALLSAALTAEQHDKAYKGQWPYIGEDMTVLALAGCIPPTANGELLAEIPPELSLPIPSAWSAVYASDTSSVATLWPQAKAVDELASQLASGQQWGDNLLVLANQKDCSALLEASFSALQDKHIGWMSLYPCDGSVWQWNRAALRTGVKALFGRGSGT